MIEKKMAASHPGTNLRTTDIEKSIHDLHAHIMRYRDESPRTPVSRSRFSKKKKEPLEVEQINQCYKNCRRSISDHEDLVKTLEADFEILAIKNAELAEEIETLKIANKKYEENIEILKEIEKQYSKEPEEEIIVFYEAWKFSPVSRPEIQQLGEYSWYLPYIKCRIPGLAPGWASFKAVVAALSPLFTAHRGEIRTIHQLHGVETKREIVEVTALDDETNMDWNDKTFCDIAGIQHSWEEVGKPGRGHRIESGDGVVFAGGGRRTVLTIDT